MANEAHQFEICLPARSPDDYLREQLAAAVEQLNATTEPSERVAIFAEVQRLRALLGIGGAA